jgi:hypothetical protein
MTTEDREKNSLNLRGRRCGESSTLTTKRAWFKENDPEGVAFKYQRGPLIPAGTADQKRLAATTPDASVTAIKKPGALKTA